MYAGLAHACGGLAALLIRGLYAWLAPDVVPFSLRLNILLDTAWVAVHALAIGWVLARNARGRG